MKKKISFIFAMFVATIFFLVGMIVFLKMLFIQTKDPIWGVTFSTKYAKELSLSPIQTFQALIEKMKVKHVRLPVYWDEVESNKNQWNFDELDQIMNLAEQKNVFVTLAIGEKVPRWPECHQPNWFFAQSDFEKRESYKLFLKTTLNRFENTKSFFRVQLENEPYFSFGECDLTKYSTFQKKREFVKSITKKPIISTVSGEWQPWNILFDQTNTLGFSLYRKAYNPFFGMITFPISPQFYRLKIAMLFPKKEMFISELQAEPWFFDHRNHRSKEFWYQQFTREDFLKNVEFAKSIEVNEIYLWGAEWWYWLKLQGDDRLWNAALEIFH